MKIKWIEDWKYKIWQKGHDMGFEEGRIFGRDETETTCIIMIEHARQKHYIAGRDFEFKTMNNHLEHFYKHKLGEDVTFVIDLFRKSIVNREDAVQKKV